MAQQVPTPAVLAVSGANSRTVRPNEIFPALEVSVVDHNAIPLVGFTVEWETVTQGAGVYDLTSTTDDNGIARTVGRAGLQVDATYEIRAHFRELGGAEASGSPVSFMISTVAPAAGSVFGAVNPDRLFVARPPDGVSAAFLPGGKTHGIAAVSDGSLYYVDDYWSQVRHVSASGWVTRVAGHPSGTAGFSGDGGPAVDAQFMAPKSLALSADERTLFVSDFDRVRAINLDDGSIDTYVGGGTLTSNAFAHEVALGFPDRLVVGP